MSNNKMTTCKTCGKEMAKSAKICPSCGAKNKKLGGVLVAIGIVIVLIAFVGSLGGNKKSSTKSDSVQSDSNKPIVESTTESVEYTTYTVDDLMSQLNENALKASNDHKGEYVRITGKLSTIDSSGKYISLLPNTDFAIIGVTCYIKNEETKAKVSELSSDSLITLTGKITEVGEVLGYSLDIDNIE